MLERDFCYWLQGIFEGNPGFKTLDEVQVETIKKHLDMTFAHAIEPIHPKEEKPYTPFGETDSEGNVYRC